MNTMRAAQAPGSSPVTHLRILFVAAMAAAAAGCGGGGTQEAVWHHPQLELLRPGRIGADDDRLVLRLLANDRLLPAPVRRILPLQADAVHA